MIFALILGAILIFLGALWPNVVTGRLIALAGVVLIAWKLLC